MACSWTTEEILLSIFSPPETATTTFATIATSSSSDAFRLDSFLSSSSSSSSSSSETPTSSSLSSSGSSVSPPGVASSFSSKRSAPSQSLLKYRVAELRAKFASIDSTTVISSSSSSTTAEIPSPRLPNIEPGKVRRNIASFQQRLQYRIESIKREKKTIKIEESSKGNTVPALNLAVISPAASTSSPRLGSARTTSLTIGSRRNTIVAPKPPSTLILTPLSSIGYSLDTELLKVVDYLSNYRATLSTTTESGRSRYTTIRVEEPKPPVVQTRNNVGNTESKRLEQKPAPANGIGEDADAVSAELTVEDITSKYQQQHRYSTLQVRAQLSAIWDDNRDEDWLDDDDDDETAQQSHTTTQDPSSKSLVWQTTTPTSTPPNIPLGRRPSAHKIVWQRLEDSPEQTAENQKEQFRKELLGGWDAEIAKMDLSRARWYLERMEQNRADKIMDQVTIIGKRKDSKPTLTKSNSTYRNGLLGRAKQKIKRDKEKAEKDRKNKLLAKQFRETRQRLEKYKNVLLKSIASQETEIKNFRNQLLQTHTEIKVELAKFTQWENAPLIKSYRKYALIKIALLDVRLQKAKAKQALARIKEDLVNDDIQTLKEGLPLVFTADYFKDPDTLTNIELEALLKAERSLEISKKSASRAYIRARSKVVVDERMTRIKFILDMSESSEVYHPYNDTYQTEMNFFILDQRYPEGIKVTRLCEALATAPQRVPPDHVINFLEEYVENLAQQYKIQEGEETARFRLFVYRAVFPKIYSYCFDPIEHDINNKDNNFRFEQQIKWLRALPPGEIDKDLIRYFKNSSESVNPFKKACDLIEKLPYEIVPTDMILIVRDVLKTISEIGLEIAGAQLSADDVFPVLLYVVIHADIHNIFEHIEYMDLYSAPPDRMGQLGYSLTTLAAACSHILSIPAPSTASVRL